MEMIQRLKQETHDLHADVEAENLATQIMDHSIDLDTYKLLLLQNYIAYEAAENAIKQFLPGYDGKKHKQLRKDLEYLDVSIETAPENDRFECHSYAEALGAAYVVEGSALGGMLLSKHIQQCLGLTSVGEYHFFNGNKENLTDWSSYKTIVEQYKFSKTEENEALNKAKQTFRFFQSIFNRKHILT